MKKQAILLAFACGVFLSFPVSAGQFQTDENGIWYKNDDGSYPTNGWFQHEADGSWYYFDGLGYARTGWMEDNGTWYYMGKQDGRMFQSCTANLDSGFYRFHSDGSFERVSDDYIGWLWDGSFWYYRKPSGNYVTGGWREIDGETYYFEEGHVVTGPAVIDGKQYFFDDNGHPAQGLTVYHKNYYYVNEDGSVKTGETVEADGYTYTFDETGAGTAVKTGGAPTAGTSNTVNTYANWPYKAITRIPSESEKSELHKTCDQMADQILAGIVNGGMNNRQKAEAIYAWVRGNLRYSGAETSRDWVKEAYNGLRRRSGNCYTYFSVSTLLLSRVGIDSIEVVRYTDNHHYWNLVNIDGSWYHFDATPRKSGGTYCLWTDAQMLSYSRKYDNCFAFDQSLYPRTP